MYCDLPIFKRCCLCLPLRRGILGFGYLNMVICILIIAVYSKMIHSTSYITPPYSERIDNYTDFAHRKPDSVLFYHYVAFPLPVELCIFVYIVEFLATAMLLYGAHRSKVLPLSVFYYYDLTTTFAVMVLQIFVACTIDHYMFMFVDDIFTSIVGIVIHVYLLLATRSLIRKLQIEGPNMYTNQLQQIVNGDIRVDNEIYNNNTVQTNQS